MKQIAVIFLFFIFALPVYAANLYVRDGGTAANGAACRDGGGGGTWETAHACDQLSTAESAAQRGDTIWVADGSYTGATCNVAASGTDTITLKKATVATHGADTGWDNAYGDGQATFTTALVFSTAYWVLDGVSRTTATTGHGFIVDTSTTHGKGVAPTGSATLL